MRSDASVTVDTYLTPVHRLFRAETPRRRPIGFVSTFDALESVMQACNDAYPICGYILDMKNLMEAWKTVRLSLKTASHFSSLLTLFSALNRLLLPFDSVISRQFGPTQTFLTSIRPVQTR